MYAPPLSARITLVPSEAISIPLINPPPPNLSVAHNVEPLLAWDCASDGVQRSATHAAHSQDAHRASRKSNSTLSTTRLLMTNHHTVPGSKRQMPKLRKEFLPQPPILNLVFTHLTVPDHSG